MKGVGGGSGTGTLVCALVSDAARVGGQSLAAEPGLHVEHVRAVRSPLSACGIFVAIGLKVGATRLSAIQGGAAGAGKRPSTRAFVLRLLRASPDLTSYHHALAANSNAQGCEGVSAGAENGGGVAGAAAVFDY
jgi:hypothetical protein